MKKFINNWEKSAVKTEDRNQKSENRSRNAENLHHSAFCLRFKITLPNH